MEMHELVKSLEALDAKLAELRVMLKLEDKEERVKGLVKETSLPDFWKDQENATKKNKELGHLQDELSKWQELAKTVSDLLEMAKMDEKDKSVNLREEIEQQYSKLDDEIQKLEFNTLMDGKYDADNAVVAIHSGSGGTEAQDWAEMLLRMYLRYCEKKGWKTFVIDESKGQEAGIKSVTFRVEGRYAYGHLKGEHGTHRLVRISPFDAEKMRHTSFALVEIIPEIEEALEVEIDPKDIRIDTFMASGHGGQGVNTTYSAVRIVQTPTNTTVSCQNERSQLQNKETALKILKSKLQKLKDEEEEEEKKKLRGEYKSPEWGSQIRSYVLHPYHLVKDLRSRHETSDEEKVLDGDLDEFIEAYLKWIKEN